MLDGRHHRQTEIGTPIDPKRAKMLGVEQEPFTVLTRKLLFRNLNGRSVMKIMFFTSHVSPSLHYIEYRKNI